MNVIEGRPYPLGVSVTPNGINIAVVCDGRHGMKKGAPLNIVLERTDGRETKKISFDKASHVGSVHYMCIEGLDVGRYTYQFEDKDGGLFTDTYAVRLNGTARWGRFEPKGAFFPESYDWEEDVPLKRSYSDMIMYLLHVRGFTRHSSSGVKDRGTFEGVLQKLPYFKGLGVNTLELMPVFEFNEVMDTGKRTQTEVINSAGEMKGALSGGEVKKINYWGFTDGFPFAPKSAYSACGNGERSFKDLVKGLHSEGIGVVIQLFFPRRYDSDYIIKCAIHWVADYHVDGIRVLGENIPKKALVENPYLKDTCLIFDEFEPEITASGDGDISNIAVLNDAFMCDNRKFLKGDADMLQAFVRHQLQNDVTLKRINFMDSYYGFTMNDMVTYDAKHNEANEEGNIDGSDYNYSWNCGVEGSTRRKSVEALRLRQLRNAFAYLLLSQGVPEFVAGDEFRNSQKGNNNAYCQDNSVTYLNWNDLQKHKELYDYVRELIDLRKKHGVFHSRERLKLSDYRSKGAPDVSIHGEQAWAPRLENYMRHIGIMYNGAYADIEGKARESDFYIAYNMHWQKHRFALPKPPGGRRWQIIMNTQTGFIGGRAQYADSELMVGERSMVILEAKADAAKH